MENCKQCICLLALWLEENGSEVWGKESAELLTAWLDAQKDWEIGKMYNWGKIQGQTPWNDNVLKHSS